MAKSKTASFYIRRHIDCTTLAAQNVTLDTSAYVDPADRQGIMIESVDFIFYNSTNNLPITSGSDRQVAVQLLTGNYTALQPYDNDDLVASAGFIVDSGAGVYQDSNVYPDLLGSLDGRIVVDDEMSILASANSAFANARCALVIKAKVVTLTNKDYMALALQTVAN